MSRCFVVYSSCRTSVRSVRPGRDVVQSRVEIGGATYLVRASRELAMKIAYDRRTDTLSIVFKDAPVAESDEDKPGVIIDYDASGNLVSLEILDASQRVTEAQRIEYQTTN